MGLITKVASIRTSPVRRRVWNPCSKTIPETAREIRYKDVVSIM